MLRFRHFANIDFVVAAGATGWAIAAQSVSALETLVSHEAAFAFAGVAFVRWMTTLRAQTQSRRAERTDDPYRKGGPA